MREIRKDLPRFCGRQIAITVGAGRWHRSCSAPSARPAARAAFESELGREIEVALAARRHPPGAVRDHGGLDAGARPVEIAGLSSALAAGPEVEEDDSRNQADEVIPNPKLIARTEELSGRVQSVDRRRRGPRRRGKVADRGTRAPPGAGGGSSRTLRNPAQRQVGPASGLRAEDVDGGSSGEAEAPDASSRPDENA